MEVTGFVIGVVSLWRTCVEIFEVIDSGRNYGMEHEILHVKLEVERIRLLTWGDAVGLSEVEQGRPSPHPRLNQDDIRNAVLRLLGCIQHVFENTARLQDSYGLRPVTPTSGHADDEGPPTQSQLILGPIFQRSYKTLLELAKHRQRSTPLHKKTTWAIHNQKKFGQMVSEIKGFNDSLENLFPDIKRYTSENIRNEINQSEDINALQTLEEATMDQHDDISSAASDRLEVMGASVARSRMSWDQHTITEETNSAPQDVGGVNSAADAEIGAESHASEEELDELSKQMKAVELYTSNKSMGALTLSLSGPYGYSPRVSAHVHWDGRQSNDTWDDRGKGFMKSSHASFDLYYRKRYIKKSRRDGYSPTTDEDYILFDVEIDPKYENVNAGTVTVEGFGRECWDYEQIFGKKREQTVFVSYADLPNVPAKKLLRRIDELRRGTRKFGWNPEQEEADLKEFFGNGWTTRSGTGSHRDNLRIGDFYSLLNRRDIFTDFTSESSIGLQWGGPKEEGIGIWNFLWQIILAKELALRLGNFPDVSFTGFTHRVLASLIVQDLWLSNVEIILTESKILPGDIKKPTFEERAKAEEFKSKGNEAFKKKQWQDAVDFYTEAMKIDLSNAVYRSNRSAALASMEKDEQASEDAYIATQLDPNYAKAWARLGLVEKKLGNRKRARNAYERAIMVAGTDATSLMKQELADAKAKIKDDLEAINKETDKAVEDLLRKKYLDEDWEIAFRVTELHSHVHEQQVEGLLLFAERMKWPYINELRDFAEDVYSNLRSGQVIDMHLHDWLYGMTLPGKWMSFKIMAALILCTPSISKSLGVAHYYDCGLSLPKQSYWRVRTVLGRVLGCLPGVVSLCGWIGPCPSLEFIPPLPEGATKELRYIHLKARRVAPIQYTPDPDDGVIHLGPRHDRYEATRLRPDEDVTAYLAEMKDPDKWVIPEPPVLELSTCTIQSIRLKKLPLDINVMAQMARKEISDEAVDNKMEYRASIVFTIDNNEDPITYTLYTNPVFVTPPPCYPGPKGLHGVHRRALPMYQKNVWTVDRLKDHTSEDFDDDVMVINATGKGAEALARAWCSERGKNAIIRRSGGPCFVCAIGTASKAGLGTGILIWVS